MRRTANDRWSVYGKNESDLVGSRLTSIAYCDHGAVPRVASKTASLPGLRSGSVIATCPPGTFVVGGGFNSGATPKHLAALAHLNRLSPTQWIVTMINLFPAATTITADRVLLGQHGDHDGLEHRETCCPKKRDRAGQLPRRLVTGVRRAPRELGSDGRPSRVLGTSVQLERPRSSTQWVVSGYNIGDRPAYLTTADVLPLTSPVRAGVPVGPPMVEAMGIEPTTSCMPCKRSTN